MPWPRGTPTPAVTGSSSSNNSMVRKSGHRPVACRHRMTSHRRPQAPAEVRQHWRLPCPLPTHQIPQTHASHNNITLFMKADDIWVQDSGLDRNVPSTTARLSSH
ncbi:hypothetical protein E4U14_004824 [Claviceps sp. LM454 group G7]|nr:hypothetical protein E4U14_004824 [Claviceps sp. LM454 group G7]